jgi:predicted nucleic acid-binding protein
MIGEASEIEERYQLSFWDALIVAAARRSGATRLLSEDLNAGQEIEGVLIENPLPH